MAPILLHHTYNAADHARSFGPPPKDPPYVYIAIIFYLLLCILCFIWNIRSNPTLLRRFEAWMYRVVWARFLRNPEIASGGTLGEQTSRELEARGEEARQKRLSPKKSRKSRAGDDDDLEIRCIGAPGMGEDAIELRALDGHGREGGAGPSRAAQA